MKRRFAVQIARILTGFHAEDLRGSAIHFQSIPLAHLDEFEAQLDADMKKLGIPKQTFPGDTFADLAGDQRPGRAIASRRTSKASQNVERRDDPRQTDRLFSTLSC